MRRFMFAVVALVMLAVVVGPAVGSAQSANARVRVVHASPDAPAVDVFVNGQSVLTGVPYFAVSPYLSVPAGAYRFQVTPAGAGLGSAVIDATATLAAGTDYTVAAVNTLARIEPLVLVDNNSPPAAQRTRVRVVHASPDAPAVDIKLAGTDTTVLTAAFKDAASVEVPGHTSYAFDITPAGSDAVVFTTPDLRFENGWVYTLFATGELGTGGFWVQSRVDARP